MDILRRGDLEELVRAAQAPCVSIYMPTHRTGKDTRENPIRFKNLIAEAAEKLERGYSKQQKQDVLAPIEALQNDGSFWQNLSDGLAIFSCKGQLRCFRLPIHFKSYVSVSDQVYIKPLVPLISTNGVFYILALSLAKVRLFQCTHFAVHEIELEGVPTTMDEVMQYHDTEEHIETHTAPEGHVPGSGAMFHGQGAAGDKDQRKKQIVFFFNQFDQAVASSVHNHHAPLILAGVKSLCSLYKHHTGYPNVQCDIVAGNPDRMDARALHEKARPIAERYYKQSIDLRLQAYRDYLGSGKATAQIEQLVPAARNGRVQILFVDSQQEVPGHFDRNSDHAEQVRDEWSEDLVNLAAVYAVCTDAELYAADQEDIHSPAAALFRY